MLDRVFDNVEDLYLQEGNVILKKRNHNYAYSQKCLVYIVTYSN